MTSESDSTDSQRVNTKPRVKKAMRISRAENTPRTCPRQIKMPPFWAEKPNIWFQQIEGQFTIFGITDDDIKFYQVLTALDRQYAAEVEDIITAPPNYENLKTELIKRLSASRENKIKQLLSHEEMGSRKPSQFLRHLKGLAGSSVPEDFIKSIWCSRLPANIQALIASQPTASLDVLADLADRVFDIVAPTPVVSAASCAPASQPSTSMESMALEIAELKEAVKNLTMKLNRRQQRQPRQRERSSSIQRNRSQSSYRKYPSCWYHAKFGSKATKCMKPCNYSSENQPGGR